MANELTRSAVIDVASEGEIVNALRSRGLNEVAARLVHLAELLADDPDEPDLVIESLRSFAEFFIQEDRLPIPEIGAGPEGFVEAEWRIPESGGRKVARDELYWGGGDGVLVMKFLPTGLVQFAATSGPAGRGNERLKASGILPKNGVMPAVETFVSRLVVA